MDQDGIKTLLQRADEHFPRLKHLWVDAGYRGEDWVQKTLRWSVELVERPKKPAPKEVLMRWAEQWMHEGVVVDWQKLMPPKGFVVLPRRWVVERSFAWIGHNRRMSKDYERLCASGEAFVLGRWWRASCPSVPLFRYPTRPQSKTSAASVLGSMKPTFN
jgi:putative transposase